MRRGRASYAISFFSPGHECQTVGAAAQYLAIGLVRLLERERIAFIDRERAQRPVLESRRDGLENVRALHRRERERIDADVGVHAAIEHEDIERHGAIEGGDED